MTISKFAFAALALAVSAAPAFAGQNSRNAERTRMPVSMDREVGVKTTIFGLPASKPTIWGHAVQDRATHDEGREITAG